MNMIQHVKIVVFAALLGALTSQTARAFDRDKLRLLIKLPTVELQFGFDSRAPGASPEVSDDEARILIAQLQKTTAAGGQAASDAESWARLGQLLQQIKQDAASKAAYDEAIRLRREAIAARPDDADALLLLGRALNGAGQKEEAETVLRRAVALNPQLGAGWTELGGVLYDKAQKLLLPDGTALSMGGLQILQAPQAAMQSIQAALRARPSDAARVQSQMLLDEASRAYERAVEVAPQSVDVYGQRIGFRSGQGFLRRLLETLQDPKIDLMSALNRSFPAFAEAFLSRATLLDFRQIARLNPDDVQALGAAGMAEISLAAAQRSAQANDNDNADFATAFAALPQDARDSLLFSLERLQTLAQNPDRSKAAPALEALGLLQLLVGQNAPAETALRRAIALDATREQAWDGLLNLMVTSERFNDMATLLQARLQSADTARNRLLLAKAYDKLQQPAQVEAQVQAAFQRAPGDPTTVLALIVVLLRRDDGFLLQAEQQLQRLPALSGKTNNSYESERALAMAFSLALGGQEANARQLLTQVLEQNPGNQTARDALALLNPAP